MLAKADELARRLGIERREFLASAMGMATTLWAINVLSGCESSDEGGSGSGNYCLPPEAMVDDVGVRCRYPIRGGLLARRPAGSITLSQRDSEPPELCAAVVGFVPRLGRSPLYDQLQRRVHVALSRRYLRRLLDEAPR